MSDEYATGGIVQGDGELPAWIHDQDCGPTLTAAQVRALGAPLLQRLNDIAGRAKPRIRRACSITVSPNEPLRRNYWWTVQHAGRHKSFPDWDTALTYANQQSLP